MTDSIYTKIVIGCILMSSAALAQNCISFESEELSESFSKICLSGPNLSGGENCESYFVVTDNWKKDLLSFCRSLKERIENSADPMMIYSSIAVSHFESLMSIVSESEVFSAKIASALDKAVRAAKDFEQGRCPDFVRGLNKVRLRRFEGADLTEFVIRIPQDVNAAGKNPVLIYSDPRRFGFRDNYQSSGMIDIWWHFCEEAGYEFKDFEFFIDVLKKKIQLDEDRFYLFGKCANGIAAMDIALKHPDIWAECGVSLGNASRHLSKNAINLPLFFVQGNHRNTELSAYYDFAVKCFKYSGCRYLKYSKTQKIEELRGNQWPVAARNKSPERVFYATETLGNPGAYWLQIDGREDENFIASADAICRGQSILVKTQNVDAYTLDIRLAPVDHNKPVEIIENGELLDTVVASDYKRRSEKYDDAAYVKTINLHGPVSDAFTEPYTIVWPEVNSPSTYKSLSEEIASGGPSFCESSFPAEMIESRNLFLLGTQFNNPALDQIYKQIPTNIKAELEKYSQENCGFIFIYPNPVNPSKYAVFFWGNSQKAIELIGDAYLQMKQSGSADAGVFAIDESGGIKWLRLEKFNTVWGWHEQWCRPLAELSGTYPQWKWGGWAAKAVRKQLAADVAVIDDPLDFGSLPGSGVLTLSKLSLFVKNDWIVKISLSGKELKQLMAELLKQTGTANRNNFFIDGISFVGHRNMKSEKSLLVSDLDDHREYTIALSCKLVNGDRLGTAIKDYRIEGHGFSLMLLRDYLEKCDRDDLDSELSGIKF
ncbi:MAG: hypothetical protein H8D47_02085 [Planctomycetes bacterium]|nr:hypothetical protein [Planctomycetota bacterium]